MAVGARDARVRACGVVGIWLAVALLVAVAAPGWAQSNFGSIRGQVKDAAGQHPGETGRQ